MSEPNAASVALIEGGRVLLIERALAPFAGLWTLPGGRREPGESIEHTATREIAEELGLAITALRPVMMMPVGHGFLLQVFATDLFQGKIMPSREIAAYAWLEPQQLGGRPTTPGLEGVLDCLRQLFEPR